MQDRFRGRRFTSVNPPDFLDHEGIELLLIGARKDVSKKLGVEKRKARRQYSGICA
jgi:hypothetical protein